MKITIRKKLYGGFAIILLLLMIVASIGFSSISKISFTYMNLINHRMTVVSDIKDLNIAIRTEQTSIDRFLLTGDKIYLTDYQDAFNAYNEKNKKIEGMLVDDKVSWQVLQGLNLLQKEFVIISDQIIEEKQKDNTDKYTELATTQGPLIQKFIQTADKLISMQEDILSVESNQSAETVHGIKVFIIGLTLFALLLGLGIAFIISGAISKPIIALALTAAKIASGDLTTQIINIKTNDEISDLVKAFSQMTINLRKVLQEVESSATHVSVSAQQLTAGAEETINVTRHVALVTEEMAVGADRQVQNIRESVNALHNMDLQADQIAINVKNVTEMINQTTELVSEGNIAVKTTVEQMDAIQHTVKDISQTVHELGEQSKKINQIIDFLSGIAAQTNLLSLNASIEAARAGEAGKGFAVVAVEVKKLAEQTADSSKQVSEVIRAILQKTEKTIIAVAEGEKEVEAGMKAVHLSGMSFDKIQSSINNVDKTIQEVDTASIYMSEGTKQLVKAFDAIAEISGSAAEGTQSLSASTEEQLATTEEVTNAAASLTLMSEELLKLITTFNL